MSPLGGCERNAYEKREQLVRKSIIKGGMLSSSPGGDKAKKGNLNLRVDLQTMHLRVNIASATWISPKLFISPKYVIHYGTLLDGSQPYTVLLKRHETKAGYLVKITVEIPSQVRMGTRLMTLDMNAGHTDFAITNKCTEQVVVTGKLNHYETQHVRKGKRDALLYKLVAKIGRVAAHYQADVVVGKLNTGKFQGGRKANRQIHQLPQYKFRHLLMQQLTKRGIQVQERSEAYTSKLGEKIAPLLGLDIHKAAAISFGLKILNYSQFRTLLSEVRSNEDSGSLRAKHRRGSELTAPYQSALTLVSDETHSSGDYPAILGSGGLLTTVSNWKANSTHPRMKIC